MRIFDANRIWCMSVLFKLYLVCVCVWVLYSIYIWYAYLIRNFKYNQESIPYRRELYRRVPLGRVHLDERRLDDVQ